MGVVVWLLAGLVVAMPYQLPPAEVEAMLLAQRWTPAASAWFAATVDVVVVPSNAIGGDGGRFEQAIDGARPRAAVTLLSPRIVEHEAHHAWDVLRGPTPEDRRLDMVALQHDPTVGPLATAILVDPSVTETHYTHALVERLGGDVSTVPAWYAVRYFGYLTRSTRHRLVFPVMGR